MGAGRAKALCYVEPSEVVDEIIQRVLVPLLEKLTGYQRVGMDLEGMYVCIALLQGLDEFQYYNCLPKVDDY